MATQLDFSFPHFVHGARVSAQTGHFASLLAAAFPAPVTFTHADVRRVNGMGRSTAARFIGWLKRNELVAEVDTGSTKPSFLFIRALH